MPVSRYGSWAQQAELEAALLEDLKEGADSDDDSEGVSVMKVGGRHHISWHKAVTSIPCSRASGGHQLGVLSATIL